jgi:hypothetical protein
MTKAKKKSTFNQTLYKKAKKEFGKAFGQYALLMHELTGIVYEQPQLYYSESHAKRGWQQPQTKQYLKEAKATEKLLNAEAIVYSKQKPKRLKKK